MSEDTGGSVEFEPHDIENHDSASVELEMVLHRWYDDDEAVDVAAWITEEPEALAAVAADRRSPSKQRNHWNESGDLVIEQKTLFRQIGWQTQESHKPSEFFPMGTDMRFCTVFAPVYQQIATWVEGEGWND